MTLQKKSIITIVIVIIACVLGFILLLKGCLSAYDERSAQPPALYFAKNGKEVIITIVKDEQCNSYKSNGNSVSKTVSVTYYLQSNDAVTGEKIATKKIKHQSDIKNYPVTVLGKANGYAWLFVNEPIAYDPFTLEKIADKETIENKNPALKGKMPQQGTYYDFNSATEELIITATDGLKYALAANSLLAQPIDEDALAASPLQVKIKALEKQVKYYTALDKQYYDMFRDYNKMYAEKKISAATYYDSTKYFNRQNDAINKIKDSLTRESNELRSLENEDRDRMRVIEQLNGSSKSYTSMFVDGDTINGKWYGLRSAKDLEEFNHRFDPRSNNMETSRNSFYTSTISNKTPGKKVAELEIGEPEKVGTTVFLQAGFLLDKTTALPIHLKNDDGFIVCYKETVGYEGKVILARIDLKGNIKWTFNTNVKELEDWICTADKLILFTVDNKELSSNDANVLNIINLQTGKVVTYDYFKDKKR